MFNRPRSPDGADHPKMTFFKEYLNNSLPFPSESSPIDLTSSNSFHLS